MSRHASPDRPSFRALVASGTLFAMAAAGGIVVVQSSSAEEVDLLVAAGSVAAAEDAVLDHGGSVQRTYAHLDVVLARLPADQVAALRTAEGVVGVTTNQLVATAHDSTESTIYPTGYSAYHDPASMWRVAKQIEAPSAWRDGFTGAGVDVAVLDTGVATGPYLRAGDVVEGAVFMTETDTSSLSDAVGHGTHMASIIAGHSSDDPELLNEKNQYTGIAPDARIVSVRAGNADGSATLDQVLSGIDWVIEHHDRDGFNIRVLNLSLAARPQDRPADDLLAAAAVAAWDEGIVVVAAAGNYGFGSPLPTPAFEPRILTVGALDHLNSRAEHDDTAATFSSGTPSGLDRPDLWAPGQSIPASLNRQSAVGRNAKANRVGEELVRGSGTSQAAAVVSGAVALLLQARPELAPDDVAGVLYASAGYFKIGGVKVEHARLDVGDAIDEEVPAGLTPFSQPIMGWSVGHGDATPTADNVLFDEDAFDDCEENAACEDAVRQGAHWNGLAWNGAHWVGAHWNSTDWSEVDFEGAHWNGAHWNGASWNGASWNGAHWNGAHWNGAHWNGSHWATVNWNGSFEAEDTSVD